MLMYHLGKSLLCLGAGGACWWLRLLLATPRTPGNSDPLKSLGMQSASNRI